MKYVEQHLTKHQLFHAPHKWFLAFLSSPLHVAERHYQQKYHLTFRHAKKLFFFDLLLLASIVALIGSTIFWFHYDPTVTSLVRLELTSNQDRIQSGEPNSYRLHITNNSDVTLVNPRVALNLPAGFVINSSTLPETFHIEDHVIHITDIVPGGSTAFTVDGIIYAIPNEEDHITATLSYTQPGRTEEEIKIVRIVQNLPDSALSIQATLPSTIIANTPVPIAIIIEHKGSTAIPALSLPLFLGSGMTLSNVTSTLGVIDNNTLTIPLLPPNTPVTIRGEVTITVSDDITAVPLRITPSILVNNTTIPQNSFEQIVQVVHPAIQIAARVGDTALSPGKQTILTLDITNTGDQAFEALELQLPLDEHINMTAFRQENIGSYRGNTFVMTENHSAALANLAPGSSQTIQIVLPLRTVLRGNNLRLSFSPTISAVVSGIAEQRRIQKTATSNAVMVGTHLSIMATSRYYTNEGDQLGRGPLPPQVGKETKYWAIIRIQNTTSRVRDMVLTTRLPNTVVWTDRHSVSHGTPLQYTATNRYIRWDLREILPGQTVSANIELAITPTEADRGKVLPLLLPIQVEGFDTFIETQIVQEHSGIDTSLAEDVIGQKKGISVQ